MANLASNKSKVTGLHAAAKIRAVAGKGAKDVILGNTISKSRIELPKSMSGKPSLKAKSGIKRG